MTSLFTASSLVYVMKASGSMGEAMTRVLGTQTLVITS